MNYDFTVKQKLIRQGQIRQLICSPWAGVMLWMNDVETDSLPAENMDYRGLWMNYCLDGSCELLVENEGYFYLGAGQLCVGPNKAVDEFRYPTGRYLGLELFISEAEITDDLRHLIRDLGFNWKNTGTNVVGVPTEMLQRHLSGLSNHLLSGTGTLEEYRMQTLELLHLIGKGELAEKEKDCFLNKKNRMLALSVASDLKENLTDRITIQKLADRYGVSVSALKKYFEIAMGANITTYRQKIRCEKAAELLRTTDLSVGEIAAMVGYAHQGKFGEIFRRTYGCSPLAYRRRQRTVWNREIIESQLEQNSSKGIEPGSRL